MGTAAVSVGSVGQVDESSTAAEAPTTMGEVDTGGDADASGGSSSAAPDDGTTESSDGGSSGALDEGSSSDDGSADECPNPLTCPMGTVIGEVSGDESSRPIAFEGAEST